jgi:hypothetical protein
MLFKHDCLNTNTIEQFVLIYLVKMFRLMNFGHGTYRNRINTSSREEATIF